MLFNSYGFILLYLPIVFTGFFWIARFSHRLAALWLAAASLFFYGWWNPKFVLLLLASITFNYAMGYAIGRVGNLVRSRPILIAAIAANLGLLGYFKYANFFISSASAVLGTHWTLTDIVLPLGISFFTFTQIAFLVDVYRGIVKEYNFIHYVLFVTYFPHLIAGPVLHHKQMMPQFSASGTYRVNVKHLATGLTIFTIGLAKKVFLADSFSGYATPVFDLVRDGVQPAGFVVAWTGALAFTLQLYFDFSGYTDMAIGLSRLLGVELPQNFNSPYKAYNIIEFWRRWHMSLSQFLRDYLYFPLGGNRHGQVRRNINLMVTMLLGGLWHGANWTFVVWGGLHGLYLVANHAWRNIKERLGMPSTDPRLLGRVIGIAVTFICVVIAWVFFRAETLVGAVSMLSSMVGAHGILWHQFNEMNLGQGRLQFLLITMLGLSIVFIAPNTQQIVMGSGRYWVANRSIGVVYGVALGICLISLGRVSEFLYFRF